MRDPRPGRATPAIWTLLAVVPLTMAAVPARAVRAPDAARTTTDAAVSVPGAGAVALPDADRRSSLERDPAWREFTARHGRWTALWNARTGSPHRAFGPAIALPGYSDDAAGVEAALRAFVAARPGLFGTPTLEIQRAQRVRGTWYVSFRQTVRGMPVLFSDWEFRVGANGRLFAFGADAHRVADQAIPAVPRLPESVTRQAARAGLRFDPVRDRVEGGATLALLPVAGEDGLAYRTVAEARVVTEDPPGDWRALVDAATGEVLWRQNQVRHAIGGVVTGAVHPRLPTDPLATRPLPNLKVFVGSDSTVTDAAGLYLAPAPGPVTVSAELRGRWCNVNRLDGTPDARVSIPASDPGKVIVAFDPADSHDAERDGYFHVNVAHDFIKALDPQSIAIDQVVPCFVNIDDVCNAFFSPVNESVNFFRAGGGCPNTATLPDVVYHEYGHLATHEVYQHAGQLIGMTNAALHEGMADVLAAMIQDDPVGGKGFFGPGTILRSLDNTRRYPEDVNPADPHVTGLIIGGAFWDLRESAGLEVATRLSHFAKYGLPDDPEAGVAMNEFFVETLVADDDDADLANGTPHAAEIVAAFNAHGIGTVFFADVFHLPLEDQPGAGPYPVTATASYAGAFGALAGPPVLHFRFNDGPWQDVTMTATGQPDEFTASIPGIYAAVVGYYVSATDVFGSVTTHPPYAPGEGEHRFIAGAANVLVNLDMETDPGWSARAPGDDATGGLWVRTEPAGSQVIAGIDVQPEEDHTPGGIQCWVTGNAGILAPPGTNDVDGGRTTLTSAPLDAAPITGSNASSGIIEPVISYWRWYTNDQGQNPGTDLWRVDISNDGGFSWVNVEHTMRSAARWRRVVFRIADYVVPTSQVRLRFTAADTGAASLVEAAVDDLQLLAFPDVVAVGDGPAPDGRLALALASAHPSSGALRLRYALPASGPVSLRLYDLAGRAVRTLADGFAEAGGHVAEWDGRGDDGTMLPRGTYFARLVAGGATVSRTLVRPR